MSAWSDAPRPSTAAVRRWLADHGWEIVSHTDRSVNATHHALSLDLVCTPGVTTPTGHPGNLWHARLRLRDASAPYGERVTRTSALRAVQDALQ